VPVAARWSQIIAVAARPCYHAGLGGTEMGIIVRIVVVIEKDVGRRWTTRRICRTMALGGDDGASRL